MIIKRYEGDSSLTEIFFALGLVVCLCVRAYRTVLECIVENCVRECVRVYRMVHLKRKVEFMALKEQVNQILLKR